MGTIARVTVDLAASAARFARDMGQAETAAKSRTAGINRALARTERHFASLDRRLTTSVRSFLSLRNVTATLVGGAGLGLVVKRSLDAADAIDKAGKTAGVSVGQLQELRFALGQQGVAAQRTDDALRRFNRRLGEAQAAAQGAKTGSEAFADAFREIGVDLRQGVGPALESTLARLAAMNDDARRAALAARVFGEDAGPQIAAALGQGIEAIDELRSQARELGIVMRKGLIEEAVEARDRLTALGAVLKARLTVAVVENVDRLNDLTKMLADRLPAALAAAGRGLEVLADNAGAVKAAIGGVVGLKLGAAFGPWGAAAGALAGALGVTLVDSLGKATDATAALREASARVRGVLKAQGEASDAAAAGAERQAIAALKTAQTQLRAAIARAEAAQAVLRVQIPGLSRDLPTRARRDVERLEAKVKQLGRELGILTGATDPLAQAFAVVDARAEDAGESVDTFGDKTEDAAESAIRLSRAVLGLSERAVASLDSRLGTTAGGAGFIGATEEALQRVQTEAETIGATAKTNLNEAEKAVDSFSQVFIGASREMGRSIQRNLADTFNDFFGGALDGFDNFWSTILDGARRFAAELAAVLTSRAVVTPVTYARVGVAEASHRR